MRCSYGKVFAIIVSAILVISISGGVTERCSICRLYSVISQMKTILVTGGAGFVGSNLIEQLVTDPNVRVFSLDNYSTGKRENHIAGATYIKGDTNDIE